MKWNKLCEWGLLFKKKIKFGKQVSVEGVTYPTTSELLQKKKISRKYYCKIFTFRLKLFINITNIMVLNVTVLRINCSMHKWSCLLCNCFYINFESNHMCFCFDIKRELNFLSELPFLSDFYIKKKKRFELYLPTIYNFIWVVLSFFFVFHSKVVLLYRTLQYECDQLVVLHTEKSRMSLFGFSFSRTFSIHGKPEIKN